MKYQAAVTYTDRHGEVQGAEVKVYADDEAEAQARAVLWALDARDAVAASCEVTFEEWSR